MFRLRYGGGIADWVFQNEEDEFVILPNTEVTFWDDRSAGTQITDLLDEDLNPVSSVFTDELGRLPEFQGPEGDPPESFMWAQAGAGPRTIVVSNNGLSSVYNRVTDLENTDLGELSDRVGTLESYDLNSRVSAIEAADLDTRTTVIEALINDTNGILDRLDDIEDTLATFGINVYHHGVDAYESRSSTTYGALTTPGPVINDVPVGPSGAVLIGIYSYFESSANGSEGFMSFAVSGATTRAANDDVAILHSRSSSGDGVARLGASFVLTGLNQGNNTFTALYKRTVSGDYYWANRRMVVIPLPFAPA